MECEARVDSLDVIFSKKFAPLLSECEKLSDRYVLPLTPPLSPVTGYDSTCAISMDCDCHRFQPICQPFADCLDSKQKLDSIVLKDIMWGYGDIGPSASGGLAQLGGCLHPQALGSSPVHCPMSLICESNKLVGVDPTEVFPMSLFDRLSNVERTEFDDESDIDVVTVDNDDSDQSDDLDSCGFLSPPKTPEWIPESQPSSPVSVAQLSLIIPVTVSVARLTTQAPSLSVRCPSPHGRPSRLEAPSSGGSESDTGDETSKCRPKRRVCLDQRLSRASHNVLERRRRNELKEKFYSLRDAIPGTKRNEKVPKVNILRNAIRFIAQLEKDCSAHELEMTKLQSQNADLKRKLLALRQRVDKDATSIDG